jgi:hypothetical protein
MESFDKGYDEGIEKGIEKRPAIVYFHFQRISIRIAIP